MNTQTQQQSWFDPRRVKALSAHVWRHFREDRCFEVSGSLSYTSLLAMVPLLAVGFRLLSSVDALQPWVAKLQDFIFRNFVPSVGQEVQRYITGFLQSTSGLTAAGTLLLIVTALVLMLKIEKTFNRIWRVEDPRRISNRLVMYWAVLTVTPLLMGLGLALTALPIMTRLGLGAGAPEWLRGSGIFIFTWLAVSLAFLLIPNRPVNWRHALIGGLLSTLLFQLAKKGFVTYVSTASYSTLYQSLATVPIFLIWLYISWLVVLLGASLAAALTTFSYQRASWRWSRDQEFQLMYRLVGHLWTAQRRGEAMSSEDLLLREQATSDSQMQRLLADLLAADIVMHDDRGDWFLARDLDELSLADLARVGHHVLPLAAPEAILVENHWDRELSRTLLAIRQGAAADLDRSLKSYYLMQGQ